MEDLKTDINKSSRLNAIIALPVIIFIFVALLLGLAGLDAYKVFEPRGVLPLLNAVFLFVCPMVVGYVAARGYMASGSVGLMMLGSGVFSFALGSLIAGFVLPDKGPNAVVTIHNCSVLLAGLFHLLGVSSALAGFQPEPDVQRRKKKLILAFSVISLITAILTYGVLRDMLPVFFIQGQGPTLLRQSILGAAALSFLISSILFLKLYSYAQSRFLYWYAMALLLIFTGLCCIFIQKSFGSPIGWTGRAAQYLAGLYLLTAVFRGAGEFHIDVKGMAKILYRLFRNQFELLLEERTGQLTLANEQLRLEIERRKRVEETLRASEEKHRILLEESSDPIFSFTQEGQYKYVNRAFAEGIGKPVGEIIGKKIWDVFPREEADKRFASLSQVFRTGEKKDIEVRVPRADGDRYYVTTITPIKDAAGEVVSAICSSKDITERRKAEEEGRVLEERLQRAEKMEALGTLAGGVAHDLNNVLGIVVGYAEMLMDEVDGSSPLRDDLMKILEGGHRSAAIVQDLLTLARRGVQTRKVVNLNAAITDCRKTPDFEKMFSLNRRVTLKTDLEADLLNIMGSPVHIGKTFINLVMNALEAMPGGGKLTITTGNQSLDKPVHGYDTVKEGDYVVLSITDTGEGISDSDIKHIFEPFYTKKVMGRSGTGLGLAVVWGTVKDHNGYIDVQSEVGRGTTFNLYLPVTREEIPESTAVIPLSDYIGNKESILVVDDIKEQRELAAKMLGKLNYKVTTVSSGGEAVQYLRTGEADLIVLDMIMDPGMDGLETYEKILEINPAQKAIIVSGFSESERVRQAQKLGAGDYLKKPYVIEKMGLAVRKELDR